MTSDRSTRASLFTMGSTRRGVSAEALPTRGFREKSVVLDAAVDEYLRLQREGTPVNKEEFCARYPDYRHSLKRMIDVEEALPAFEQLEDDFWPEVGSSFLGYDILDLLGAGSIARVFLAAEIKLGGRSVAIKVSRHGGYEAETLGKLRHPNIVEVYSVTHDDESGLTIVCMPYQGSATLSDLLDVVYRDQKPPLRAHVIAEVGRQMALPAADSDDETSTSQIQKTLERGTYVDGVVHLGMQLASALQYAHDHGVLHRDLKPSNVLLTPSGRPMLLDFNLSFDEALNMVHRGGTLPYSAPEQLREAIQVGPISKSAVDARADIFSLGAILYELLTGQLPFGSPPSDIGPRQAIQLQIESQKTRPIPIRQINARVDARLEAIILRCLSEDPEQRFSCMLELEAAFHCHFQKRRRAQRWLQRHWLLSSGFVGVAALMLVAAAISIARIPPYWKRQHDIAISEMKRGNFPTATQHLSNALQVQPADGKILFLRGVTKLRSKDAQGAMADFVAARKEGFDTEGLWVFWGYALYKGKGIDKLVDHYQTACSKHPESSDLRLSSIYARHLQSHLHKVTNLALLAELDEFVDENPERFEGYLVRAIIRYRLSRLSDSPFEQAVLDIEKACARCSPIAAVEFEAATILAAASKIDTGRTEQAKKHLEKAVQLGWSRRSTQTLVEFAQWTNAQWFNDLLDHCTNDEGNPEPSIAELAFRPSQSVQRQLPLFP